MIRTGFAALASHWRRAPLQLVTLLAGLALATALWSGVQAINAEARASYDAAAATLGEGRFDQLLPRSGETLPQSVYIDLRRAGWLVGPVVEGRLQTEAGPVRLVGLDPLTMPGGVGAMEGQDDLGPVVAGSVLFAHPEAADRLEGREGLDVRRDPAVAPGTAVGDIGLVQRLLDMDGRLSRLVIDEAQPMGRPPLDAVAPGLVRQQSQQTSDIGRLTDSFHLNLTAFGALSFAVGLFIVHGAIGLVFEQRRPLIRTLRALGLPMRTLLALLAAELLGLALIAGAVGVALGYLVAAALLPDVAATLGGLYGAQVAGSVQLRPEWWATGLGIAVAGAAVAGGGALWRIARMPILQAAGHRAWSVAGGRGRMVQAALGLALLALAGVFAATAEGLPGGFALLGCLLTGAALLLPALLGTGLAAAGRLSRGAVAQWFWADTRGQLPGLSLSFMALLLAMAANIGVATMVESFRLTFVGFLDQRLTAELYVETPRAEALETFAAERGAVVLPTLVAETRLEGRPAQLRGLRIDPAYTENWQFVAAGPDPWARVAAGEAVILSEQLARRADLWPGDEIRLSPDRVLPVAAVASDYGNPAGQAIVAEPLFRDLAPGVETSRFALRTADAEGLRTALVEDFGLPEAAITDQAALKRFSLDVFERTFTVTGALNVLTLAVAGFAILMSLLTLAAMRLPQLAPAWALGLTRAALGRLELARTVALAAAVAVLAVPLGLALAWVLLRVVNVAAFGWSLPMFLFPLDYARLAALAVVAAGLAAGWPALRLARTPPADLLRVFANDR